MTATIRATPHGRHRADRMRVPARRANGHVRQAGIVATGVSATRTRSVCDAVRWADDPHNRRRADAESEVQPEAEVLISAA